MSMARVLSFDGPRQLSTTQNFAVERREHVVPVQSGRHVACLVRPMQDGGECPLPISPHAPGQPRIASPTKEHLGSQVSPRRLLDARRGQQDGQMS